MKTFHYTLLAIFGSALFSSCSGNLQIEKRHYRNGWYISKDRTHEKTSTTPVEELRTSFVKDTNVAATTETPVVTEVITSQQSIAETIQPAKKNTVVATAAKEKETIAPVTAKRTVIPVHAEMKQASAVQPAGERNVPAILSLVFGLLAILGCFSLLAVLVTMTTFTGIGLLIVAAIFAFSILAIVLGRHALRTTEPGAPDRGMAVAGKVLGIVAMSSVTAGILLLAALIILLLSGGGLGI